MLVPLQDQSSMPLSPQTLRVWTARRRPGGSVCCQQTASAVQLLAARRQSWKVLSLCRLIVAGHRPFLIDSTNEMLPDGDQPVASQLREAFEDLFFKHRVSSVPCAAHLQPAHAALLPQRNLFKDARLCTAARHLAELQLWNQHLQLLAR